MKGISLRQNDNDINEQLVINQAKAQLIDYHQAFTINIQNPQPNFVRNVETKIEVFKGKQEEPIVSEEKNIAGIAPNTNVDFPIFYDEVLQPGKYKLSISLKNKNLSLKKVINFNVTRAQVKTIREAKADAQNSKTKLVSEKFLLLIVIAILMVFLLIYYIKFYKK